MRIFLLVVALLLVVGWLLARRRLGAPDLSGFDAFSYSLQKPATAISAGHQAVLHQLEAYHRNAPGVRDVAAQRRNLEDLFAREVESRITPVEADGIPAEWVQAEGVRPGLRLLFLHGGAFRAGSPRSHRVLTDALSRGCGASVLSIDYRMQPEHPLLACHEDAQRAYRWLLENGPDGASPAQGVFVAGDSAGGNLTLALLAWARDQGLRQPDAAVAFAPATDMTLSSPSWRRNVATDPFLGPGIGRLMRIPQTLLLLGSRLLGRVAPNDPRVSPLLGDLAGLPPTLIQVSEQEVLFDDARRYAAKATAAGSPVSLEVWPTMVHVFQAFAPELPEANDALARASAFLRAHVPQARIEASRAG